MMIFTIGHSIRPFMDTLALLQENKVSVVADVRAIPRSRRNPQYNSEAFAKALALERIGYRHMPMLGGMRKPKPDSPNQGLKDQGFRGFADYMQTPEFETALGSLMDLALANRVAYMCAEAKPSDCHRSLISDALTARGVEVRHIFGPGRTERHVYTDHAEVQGGRVRYPFGLESRV
ncbi:MAG TPA: DUF488 domain-containing protein [Gammaproteobacteria bacterium]|nr:DUF488 domain-containing protein [Gammaproteobacteria bacterium]